MEWELTSPQLCSYIQTSKKKKAPHSYVNFEKKIPKRDFPYLSFGYGYSYRGKFRKLLRISISILATVLTSVLV